jgi:hypothetical protein
MIHFSFFVQLSEEYSQENADSEKEFIKLQVPYLFLMFLMTTWAFATLFRKSVTGPGLISTFPAAFVLDPDPTLFKS